MHTRLRVSIPYTQYTRRWGRLHLFGETWGRTERRAGRLLKEPSSWKRALFRFAQTHISPVLDSYLSRGPAFFSLGLAKRTKKEQSADITRWTPEHCPGAIANPGRTSVPLVSQHRKEDPVTVSTFSFSSLFFSERLSVPACVAECLGRPRWVHHMRDVSLMF